MAERAEELRDQLDAQRAGISRTVEQIENRVTPGRVLSRRRYRMRRSVMDWKDRLMGNDEPDYPAHWYAQPAAPLGPEYAYSEHGYRGTRYTFDEGDYHDEGGRMSEVGDRARGTMQQARGQASGMAHEAQERASGMAHEMSEQAHRAPETMRRQTQGNPIALGIMAFGAGLLAGTILPESRRERDLARRAQPQMQRAVEEGRHAAEEVVMDLREPAEESMEQVKETAATEAQAFKAEATEEAKRTRSDVESAARE